MKVFILVLLVGVSLHSVTARLARSCSNRCGVAFNKAAPCQCDLKCSVYKNCCPDYNAACKLAGTDIRRPVLFPTDGELRDLGNQLWGRDVNRGTRSQVVVDVGGTRLFEYVDPSLVNRFTYTRFRALFDNYEPEIGIPEPDCPACLVEEEDFLDAIMDTTVMQHAWGFLIDHGLASDRLDDFKLELRQYWFLPYSRSRGAAIDSSGFEHVFLGEVRGTSVTGFHNWVFFYDQEQRGQAQYTEYLDMCQPDLLKIGFDWLGRTKPVSSFFFGVSPEFEMALFTVCFQARQTSNCNLQLNGMDAQIRSFSMSNVSPRTVGTAYPNC